MRLVICAGFGAALALFDTVVTLSLRWGFHCPYPNAQAQLLDSIAPVITGFIAAGLLLKLWKVLTWDKERHHSLIDEIRQALQIITHSVYLHNQNCPSEHQWSDQVYHASDRIQHSLVDIEPKQAKVIKLQQYKMLHLD